MDYIGYIIFLFVSLLCCYLSKKILKTYYSFTIALTFPYLLICSLQALVSLFSATYTFPILEYWLIISIYLSIVLSFEIFFQWIFHNSVNCSFPNVIQRDPYNKNRYFNFFIIGCLLYVLYSTYKQITNIDIGLLFQEEFQDEFQSSGGGSFYTRLFLMIIGVYLLSYRKKVLWILLGIICFVPNIVVNTKGILFIPILAIIYILLIYRRFSNPLKAFLLIVGFGFFIFLGSYILQFLLEGNNLSYAERFQSILYKFYSYLTAGVQSFSYNINHDADDSYFQYFKNSTVAPFNSLLSKFGLSETYSNVTPLAVPTGYIPNYGFTTSNVNTFVGTLYLYNGFLGGICLLVLWLGISCYIRYLAYTTRHPFTMVLLAMYYAGYLLGWFEFYFMHTFWIYFIVFVFVINLILNNKIVVWKNIVLQSQHTTEKNIL